MNKYILLAVTLLLSVNLACAKIGVGDPAPDFTLTEIRTGTAVSLSDFSGQVVVLHFWKVCAGSCKKVFPALNRMHEDFLSEAFPDREDTGSLLKVLSVNVTNPAKKALASIEKNDVEFQVLEGKGSGIAGSYQIVTLPMVLVIDREGFIRHMFNFPQYEELKEAALPLVQDLIDQESRETDPTQ